MAGRKLKSKNIHEKHRQASAPGLALAGLLIAINCIDMLGRCAFGQPGPEEPLQWKQSVERPSRNWDYDGKRILGHIGHDICLWDAVTGELLHKMKGHRERIHAVQLSTDGKHALSSSWIGAGGNAMLVSRDTRVILWSLDSGQAKHNLHGQVAGEISPDGTRIVTFSQRPDTGAPDPFLGESTLPGTAETWRRGSPAQFDAAVWEMLSGRNVVRVPLDDGTGPYWDALHFSPDGSRFVSFRGGAHLLDNPSSAVLYDAEDGRELGRAAAEHGIHRYTSCGALAVFDSERASRIDIMSGRTLATIEHGLKAHWRGAWTHDGRKVAAFPVDGKINIWDMESGQRISGAKAGTYPQRTAIISPDNARLAISWGAIQVGSHYVPPEFGLYDLSTGTEISVFQLADGAHLIGFSPDSKTILIGGEKFLIHDSADGKRIRAFDRVNEVDLHGSSEE